MIWVYNQRINLCYWSQSSQLRRRRTGEPAPADWRATHHYPKQPIIDTKTVEEVIEVEDDDEPDITPADYEWSLYVPAACARPSVIHERSNTSWIDHQESGTPAESQSDEIIEGGTVNYGQILILSLQLWRNSYQISL